MLIIDIILLIIILGFFIRGWQKGLVRTLAGFIGLLLGVIIASHYHLQLADWLMTISFLETKASLAKIISFAAIFFIVNGIIAFGAFTVDKTFAILSFIPFLKTINRLAGAVLNLVAGIILIGLVMILLVEFPILGFIRPYLAESQIAPFLILIVKLLSPLWPEFIKNATELTEKAINQVPLN